MYAKGPSAADLAALGLLASDLDDSAYEVWPDAIASVNVFVAMNTQWRGNGSGLDYSALPEVWRRCGVPRNKRDEIFDDLRLMEGEALTIMAEERERG